MISIPVEGDTAIYTAMLILQTYRKQIKLFGN